MKAKRPIFGVIPFPDSHRDKGYSVKRHGNPVMHWLSGRNSTTSIQLQLCLIFIPDTSRVHNCQQVVIRNFINPDERKWFLATMQIKIDATRGTTHFFDLPREFILEV
jgi:hypothetical protein